MLNAIKAVPSPQFDKESEAGTKRLGGTAKLTLHRINSLAFAFCASLVILFM